MQTGHIRVYVRPETLARGSMSEESLSRYEHAYFIVLSNPTVSSPRFRFGRLVRRRWFPIGWRQGGDVVLVRHRRKPGEEIFDVDERIDAVAQARHDDRINNRRALARLGGAMNSPFFFPSAEGQIAFSIRLLARRPRSCWPTATSTSRCLSR